MTDHVTILRGLPGTGKVPAAGGPYRGTALAPRPATYAHFAGTSPADAFGAVLVARGRLVLHGLLIVPDGTDADALSQLRRWGERHPVETPTGALPWRVVTLSAYFTPNATRERQPWAFTPNAYTGAGPVVGADLGTIFGAVAEHVEKRQGRNTGGWQVWPPGWGRFNTEQKKVDKLSRHRLPLYVSSRRVGWSVEFAPPKRGFGKWTTAGPWRGEFVDLLSTAYSLDADRSAGFVEHARNFDVAADDLPVVASLDAHGAARLAAAVGQVHALALRLDDVAGRYFTSSTDRREGVRRLPLAHLQSPAAIADHLLRQFKVTPPLAKYDLTEGELAHWWEGFHGARNDDVPALRGRPFGAAVLDLSSCYPLVDHHIGGWDFLTAHHLERRPFTAEARALCERVAADPSTALDPSTWRTGGVTLVELAPDGDVLPLSLDDPKRPDGRSETVPVTARGRTMHYSLLDALASAVTTGRAPRIVRATRLVPVGRQDGLRHRVPFLPGVTVDVEHGPVLPLVARRRQAKAETDTTTAPLLHAAVNALVSGKPSELHDVYRKAGGAWERVERNGPWTFPPLAVTNTAGARLLLATLDRLVRDLGSLVAYRDTDSSIVPASPDGGTLTLPDGSTVRELPYAEVRELVGAFESLSPDPGHWPVWKMDPKPGEAPLRCLIFGPKRHTEYRGTDDAPELVEWTESTLGGSWSDPAAMQGRCAEGGRAWSKVAVEREVRYAAAKLSNPRWAGRGRPSWDLPGEAQFPTLRRLAVTSPALGDTLPGALGPIRPGLRYLQAVPGTSGARVETVHVVARDPGGALDDWSSLEWVDRRTGAPVQVTTDPVDLGAILVESLAERAGMYGARPPGESVSSVLVTPLSVRYAGRVSPVLDADDDGVPGPLADRRLRYEDSHGLGPGQREALVDLASSLPRVTFAELARVKPSTAARIARGDLPRRSTARILAELRRFGGAWTVPGYRTCQCGCGSGLPPDRPSFLDDRHRERAKKRRQRAGAIREGAAV